MARGNTVTVTFAGDTLSLERATDRAERKLDRFGDKANGLSAVFTKAGSVSTLAIAGIGLAMASLPVVAGLAIAGVVGIFGGIGIAAAAQSEAVKREFSELSDHVVKTVKELAKPFEPVLIDIANKTQSTFDRITPALKGVFEDVAPLVETLADSIIGPGGLVEGFIGGGGLQTAIEGAKPVIEAIAQGFKDMGPALSEFLKGLTGESGGEGAAEGVRTLFDAINGILPALGSFLGFLGDNSDILIPLGGIILGVAAAIRIAAAAQWLWNFAMFANPVGLIVLGIIALIAWLGFLAFHWRDIARIGATAIGSMVLAVFNFKNQVVAAFQAVANFIIGIVNRIVDVWNSTIARLAFPSFPSLPSIGGFGSTGGRAGASLPKKHGGGVVPGRIGSEVMAVLQAGERVVPIGGEEKHGGAMTISFAGNTDGAFASAFMGLVRSGAIQVATR